MHGACGSELKARDRKVAEVQCKNQSHQVEWVTGSGGEDNGRRMAVLETGSPVLA